MVIGQPEKTLPELLTTNQVAARLQVSPRTVRRFASEGRLPQLHVGTRLVRYATSDVLSLLSPWCDHNSGANRAAEKAVERPA